ncbi:MAG: cytochrome C assembly family protein [Pyrinomonadaceae bacterium]
MAYIVAAIYALFGFLRKQHSLSNISLVALICGFVVHTLALILDVQQSSHLPFFQLREIFSLLAWALVVAYFLASRYYRIQALEIFLLPVIVILLFLSMITPENDGVPGAAVRGLPGGGAALLAGAGAWIFPIHTTLLIFSYASFFVVFIASVMYLMQERELKHKTFGAIFHRLPSLTTVDDISTTAAGLGFTFLTLGIAAGMLWASTRDGRIWHNDPKEIFAVLTWALYMVLIHSRYVGGWRGRKAAWFGVAGFALVLCTFLGTRLMGGYHVFG